MHAPAHDLHIEPNSSFPDGQINKVSNLKVRRQGLRITINTQVRQVPQALKVKFASPCSSRCIKSTYLNCDLIATSAMFCNDRRRHSREADGRELDWDPRRLSRSFLFQIHTVHYAAETM